MLFANNQHPIQLESYAAYNNFIKTLHSVEHAQADENLAEKFTEAVNERKALLNTNDGESLTIDEIEELWIQVKGVDREN